MTKQEKYVEQMSKTPVIQGITTDIVANELCARALLKILIDKGIVSSSEWQAAIQFMTERYIELHMEGLFEEKYEPDFMDLRSNEV